MDRCWRASVVRLWGNARLAALVVGVALGWFLFFPSVAAAQAPPDAACRLCHGESSDELTLPSGETLSVGIDLAALDQSVHGSQAAAQVYCTDCHRGAARYRYPHAPNPAHTRRDFVAEVNQNCANCHEPIELHNPGHLQAQDQAQLPLCTDCHGGHDAVPAPASAAERVGACTQCHQTYDDPQVQKVHAELVANLGPDQDCQTCHADVPVRPADAQCRTCHTLLTSQITLASGETVDLRVDVDDLANSVHGTHQLRPEHGNRPLLCTECHREEERYKFPHTPITAQDRRGLTLEMGELCAECHEDIARLQHDGIHALAQEEGKLEAATCADCHGSHSIQPPNEPRERISQTCGKCHSTINADYSKSVHGAALLGEHNPDVPVCIDCHGVHNIANPTTPIFRVNSPDLCAGCHADKELMAKYGISTDVFDTYVADFHGTTVTLFEKQHPEQATNKAVCYDCHGIHDILPANDEHSQVIKDNLVTTCRKCHPDASASFPNAWTSHFKPSLEHNPLVYLVNLFYTLLIPAVVGAMVLFIGTDVYRRFVRWPRRRKENE